MWGVLCGKSGLTPTPSAPYLQGTPVGVLTFFANYQFGDLLFLPLKLLCHLQPIIASLMLTQELPAYINPFAPEPLVTARADPGPFYPL